MYRSTFSWPQYQLVVSGHVHVAEALFPGESSCYPLDRTKRWASGGVDNMGRREFSTLQGLQLHPLSRRAHNPWIYCLRSICYKMLCIRSKIIFFWVIDFVFYDGYIPKVRLFCRVVRNSVLPLKFILASDFVNAIIDARRDLWGMTIQSLYNIFILKDV
jgi:hypothetical protein